jgi:hypothetical protein
MRHKRDADPQLFHRGERRDSHTGESLDAQVKDPGCSRWRYLPFTRTRCELLTWGLPHKEISRTIGRQNVDLLPLVQDQVDGLPRIAGTEIPATNGTVWVVSCNGGPFHGVSSSAPSTSA